MYYCNFGQKMNQQNGIKWLGNSDLKRDIQVFECFRLQPLRIWRLKMSSTYCRLQTAYEWIELKHKRKLKKSRRTLELAQHQCLRMNIYVENWASFHCQLNNLNYFLAIWSYKTRWNLCFYRRSIHRITTNGIWHLK